MRKGITSTIIFTLPSEISVSELVEARITVQQRNTVCANHSLSELEMDVENNALKLQLSQEEALRLTADRKAEVQLKIKVRGGAVLATDIHRVDVRDILNEEVI